jgi:cell division septum initiation protein DivIVA
MELERSSIEKRDFSAGRRGYERAEVDRHLSAIADAVEQLKAAPPAQGTVAGVTAQRVEAIVAAAEASAREIEERANADAGKIRERAEGTAAAHVKRAEEIAAEMAGRAAELQQQISLLIEQIAALNAGIGSAPLAEPVAEPAPIAEPELEPEIEPEPEPEPAIEQAPPPEKIPSEPAAAEGPRAPEGARLIALNMALSGTPREETARYLRENYELENEDALLDDVYLKAGS